MQVALTVDFQAALNTYEVDDLARQLDGYYKPRILFSFYIVPAGSLLPAVNSAEGGREELSLAF